jgi:stage II sporulation protein D
MGSTTLWTLEDRDTGQVIASVRAEELEVEGFNLRLNLKPAPGRLRFVPTQVGSVDVIASLDLEEYVRGVLPSEMPATWPLETLKAQAIAARTYALFRKQIREREQGKYDVESTVMDQVFFAPDLNDESEARAQVDRALEETRGVVLLDHAARPFATYFHADCGGHTEEPSQVWGTSERLGTARDEGCPSSPLAHWSLKLSSQEIAERLQPRKGLALADIQIASRTPFGRVDSVKLRWNNGSSQILSSHLFRMAIGFDRLRSTRFTIVRESGREAGLEGLAGRLIFKGLGHGHGVGLCQWGARHLALKGKSYREILAHYYPRATLSDARSLAAQARP